MFGAVHTYRSSRKFNNKLNFGSGVFHFLLGNYISNNIVRFKMKERMLVQVALNFSHRKPKVSIVQ